MRLHIQSANIILCVMFLMWNKKMIMMTGMMVVMVSAMMVMMVVIWMAMALRWNLIIGDL